MTNMPKTTLAVVGCGAILPNLQAFESRMMTIGAEKQSFYKGAKIIWTKAGSLIAEAIRSPETLDWRLYEVQKSSI